MDRKELEARIKSLAESYYIGEAQVTDEQFDSLVSQLREIDPENPLLHKTGWGYEVSGNKVKHPLVDVKGLDKRRIEPSDPLDYEFVTPKFDGANTELVYVSGKLDKAISRGDGEFGQDITRHLKWIVPGSLLDSAMPADLRNVLMSSAVSISGEFLLPRSSKEKFYPTDMAFRNIPAGFLGRKESKEGECRRFAFMPYRINAIKSDHRISPVLLEKLSDRYALQCLLNRMFSADVPIFCRKDSGKSTFAEIAQHYDSCCDFYYDGIVINSSPRMGVTEKETESGWLYVFAYDEIAYKINKEYADVALSGIEWNLTRTGKLVPVAEFEGTELAGAIVRRATLHNAHVVEANGLREGSVIRIIRSGEVIPYVTGVTENGEYRPLE